MDAQDYIVLFNICAFAVVILMLGVMWRELKNQERRRHDQIDRITAQFSGLTLVVMDHGQRIARMEGLPFQPAAVFEKLGGAPDDPEGRELMQRISRYLQTAPRK